VNSNSEDRVQNLKVIISAVAAMGLVLHVVYPHLAIDAISLGLLVITVLPWLAPLVKAAELPGGFKIEFHDVKAAADQVTAGAPEAASLPAPVAPSYLAIAEQDPNLALVGLRIEIEKRIRALAEQTGIPKSRPLTQLTNELQERQILSSESLSGLRDLIGLGNRAAHGVEVSRDVAYFAADLGPKVLQILDAKLASYRPPA